MEKGIIFNIQQFTINDGPGIRTEIFMKGCPMRCKWCSNPESQKLASEPGVYPSKCISEQKCGLCTKVCKQQALLFGEEKIWGIDRSKCIGCTQCVEACPSEAIKRWGEHMTVEEVMKVIEKDRKYYERSGGGMTVSGGDPLVQHEFTELLKASREAGIHTCLESTFYADWDIVADTVQYADLLISDVKHMDGEIHKKYTGMGCEQILDNLAHLAREGHEMILRIPVIPGINDDMEHITSTADFLESQIGSSLRTLQLFKLHADGRGEMCFPGKTIRDEGSGVIDREEFQKQVEGIADYFNSRGIHCVVGTEEKE